MLIYDKENPETINSAVCFVDILGFTNLVKESFKSGTGNDLLKRLHKSLTQGINLLRPKEEYVGILKTFTDNIVIGHPIYNDGESQLGSIFLNFAAYQLSLTLEGFFVRGAVSIGDYYANDEFAYGPALLEAHYLESKEAKTPRIILSNDTVKMVHQHIDYYGKPEWAPQSMDLLKDNSDGKYFINYLEAAMRERELYDYPLAFEILMKHKKIIEKNLNKFQEEPNIFSKYEWAAQYHNFFVDHNFQNPYLSQLFIPNVTQGDISLII